MSDQHWFGQAVYNNVTNRDNAAALLRDYAEATEGVMNHASGNYAAGVQVFANLHFDEETSGPGVEWSFRVTDSETRMNPAALWAADHILSAPGFVDGNQGNGSLG